jgi:hypothetical protein
MAPKRNLGPAAMLPGLFFLGDATAKTPDKQKHKLS